jgi:Uma2 family endonuclease
MAILEHELRSAQSSITGMHRRLFTLEQYYSLVNSGLLGDGGLELIEGELVDMAPIGDPHSALVDPLARMLVPLFGPGYSVRTQSPILIATDPKPSVPQPDIVVAKGDWREYRLRKPAPTDIELVVEIADTTLASDRSVKMALYAEAGIMEYWIVNLVEDQVEVYREPLDARYAVSLVLRPGETIEPLATPGRSIAIADFLL